MFELESTLDQTLVIILMKMYINCYNFDEDLTLVIIRKCISLVCFFFFSFPSRGLCKPCVPSIHTFKENSLLLGNMITASSKLTLQK